jgi:hypothetical protein
MRSSQDHIKEKIFLSLARMVEATKATKAASNGSTYPVSLNGDHIHDRAQFLNTCQKDEDTQYGVTKDIGSELMKQQIPETNAGKNDGNSLSH